MNVSTKISINKKSNSLVNFLIGAVALLLFIFVVNLFGSAVKNTFYALSSPFQKTFWTAGESSSSFLGSFLNAGSMSKENENLKNQNQKLLSEIIALKSIEQGNQAQTNVSAACQNSGFKLLMAGVIGLDGDDILSINKGSADGIAIGMPVIDQQRVLYGKVFKVYKNFSKIILISNKNSITNVKIQQNPWDAVAINATTTPPAASAERFGEPKEIDGVLKGNGGLKSYLDLIPISSNINPQDVLVTSAVDKLFPKDLLIGTIIQKVKNDQEPFQQAQVNLFFNVKKIDNLFVITNYKQTN